MKARSFTGNRNGAVSVMFAAAAIPMVGLIGLAVDYGVWNQENSVLSVAANVAALTAVKIAANATAQADNNWQAEGQLAGTQWFNSEVGSSSRIGTEGVTFNTGYPSVVVTNTKATISAQVSYSGFVPSVFGGILFDVPRYNISGSATAAVTFAPYLNVEILLDDSGSMEIGALNSDIQHLQAITPCYPNLASLQYPNQVTSIPSTYVAPGAFYNGSTSNLAGQAYSAYNYDAYDGSLIAPTVAYKPPQTYSTFVESGGNGPTCQGVLPAQSSSSSASSNASTNASIGTGSATYPTAGPPCAFACHFDTSAGAQINAGSGNDYYGLARSTIGSANPITLRFDLVKQATNQVISAMQQDNITAINNLNVGIFKFADTFSRVYPPAATGTGEINEAGDNWATAIADVGAAPTTPNGPDTGIQPYNGANGGNSDFHDTLNNILAQKWLSVSYDGTCANNAVGCNGPGSGPRKVLFIITDGLQDYTNNGNRTIGGIDPDDCQLYKNLGYTVYVVFTPYYPVMNGWYVGNVKPFTEPVANSTISQDMQACSSNPSSDYVAATDGTTLNAALQQFLLSALEQPARFTQ